MHLFCGVVFNLNVISSPLFAFSGNSTISSFISTGSRCFKTIPGYPQLPKISSKRIIRPYGFFIILILVSWPDNINIHRYGPYAGISSSIQYHALDGSSPVFQVYPKDIDPPKLPFTPPNNAMLPFEWIAMIWDQCIRAGEYHYTGIVILPVAHIDQHVSRIFRLTK